MTFSSIEDTIQALQEGKPIIVADDANRENEGDIIFAAQTVTAQSIGWMVRHTSGFLCAPMPNSYANRLNLDPMVISNQDPRKTNYTVSVDAASGITTGISSADRALTLRTLADPSSTPKSFIRPGHILPLRAAAGGVRERSGHTEAAVDLLKLANLEPVGVIAELVTDAGDMMGQKELIAFAKAHNAPFITIQQIIAHLNLYFPLDTGDRSERIQNTFLVETEIPTQSGQLRFRAYRDHANATDHLVVIAGAIQSKDMLVRIHSECITGEAFGSLKCECGPQLQATLERISIEGGMLIYLRGHEGRGIGLGNKLRAYQLQEKGLDTIDANTKLGFPADARNYRCAAEILKDLGIKSIRLLTNNPDKKNQLLSEGINISETLPLVVGLNAHNKGYLESKRDRMFHTLPSFSTLPDLSKE